MTLEKGSMRLTPFRRKKIKFIRNTKFWPSQTGSNASWPTKNVKSQTLFWRVLGIQTSWILLNEVFHYTTSHLKKWNLTLPNPKIIRGAQCAPPPTVGLHGFYNRGWHQVCEVHKGDGRQPNGGKRWNDEWRFVTWLWVKPTTIQGWKKTKFIEHFTLGVAGGWGLELWGAKKKSPKKAPRTGASGAF